MYITRISVTLTTPYIHVVTTSSKGKERAAATKEKKRNKFPPKIKTREREMLGYGLARTRHSVAGCCCALVIGYPHQLFAGTESNNNALNQVKLNNERM